MHVLNQYLNRLFDIIQESALDPREFETQDISKSIAGENRYGTSIVLSNFPNYRFNIYIKPPKLNTFDTTETWVTGPSSTSESDPVPADNFLSVSKRFMAWLEKGVSELSKESSMPNMFEIAHKLQISPSEIDFNDDSKFSIGELESIETGLNEIKSLLENNFILNHNQLKVVNKRIDYLTERSSKLSKRDWKNITVSTVIAIAFDLSLDPEKQQVLFGLFSKIWKFVQLLPPPPLV